MLDMNLTVLIMKYLRKIGFYFLVLNVCLQNVEAIYLSVYLFRIPNSYLIKRWNVEFYILCFFFHVYNNHVNVFKKTEN